MKGWKPTRGWWPALLWGQFWLSSCLLVVQFAIKDPDIKPVMRITAVAIFLLLVGIGLFQPIGARYEAYRYRRKALRVADPRVWFRPMVFIMRPWATHP